MRGGSSLSSYMAALAFSGGAHEYSLVRVWRHVQLGYYSDCYGLAQYRRIWCSCTFSEAAGRVHFQDGQSMNKPITMDELAAILLTGGRNRKEQSRVDLDGYEYPTERLRLEEVMRRERVKQRSIHVRS